MYNRNENNPDKVELHVFLKPRRKIKNSLLNFYFETESQRPANKRRKRKGSNSGGAANNVTPAPNKKRSPGPNFSLASQVKESYNIIVF